MALDTRRKRMAATNIGCPWRGPMIHPTVTGFDFFDRGVVLGAFARIVPPPIPVPGRTVRGGNQRIRSLRGGNERIRRLP